MTTQYARRLYEAQAQRTAIPQLSLEGGFSLETAYDIQHALLALHYSAGDAPSGIKLGFTSQAKMKQMGVHELIIGSLTAKGAVQPGDTLSIDRFIHPRVEPELCFLVSRAIDRPLALNELHHYFEAVAPAMEIIDSRYQNFSFNLQDVVADNCSGAAYVTGSWLPFRTDVSNLGMVMTFDGEAVQTGSSAAILGHPHRALAEASRLALKYGFAIPEGSILYAGAATEAVFLRRGTCVETQVQGMDDISFLVS